MIIKESSAYTIGKRYKYFVCWCYTYRTGYTYECVWGRYMTMRSALQGFKQIKKNETFTGGEFDRGWFLRIEHVYYESPNQ